MISLISDNLFDFFKILLKQSKFLTCITMKKNSQKGLLQMTAVLFIYNRRNADWKQLFTIFQQNRSLKTIKVIMKISLVDFTYIKVAGSK